MRTFAAAMIAMSGALAWGGARLSGARAAVVALIAGVVCLRRDFLVGV